MLLLLVLLCVSLASSCKGLDGWLTDFSYRRIFYWQSDLDNAQDSLTVDYILNQTQPDMEDLRVTLNDGTTLLPVWNESTVNMDYCKLWCKFPTANTTYYLYWGNPDAVAVWNQTAVFIDVLSDVVLALPMDEGEGTAVTDYSGYGNDGVITDAVWVSTGAFGNGVLFDNATDEIVISDSASLRLGSVGTVALYFSSSGAQSGVAGLVVKEAGGAAATISYSLYRPNDAYINLYLSDGLATNVAAYIWDYSDTDNHFITGQWNSSNLWVSFDTLKSAVQTQTLNPQADFDLTVGNWFAQIKGVVSGIYIFNCSLTNGNVEDLNSNYPDPKLEEGKVTIRTWGTATVTMWGETETYTAEPEYSNNEILVVAIALIIIFTTIPIGLIYSRKQD